jgi:hypothetical protein
MSKAHNNGVPQEEMSPSEAKDERIRRMDECVFKLLALPIDDRDFVVSLVTNLQREIDVALLEKRVAEKGSLQKFLDDLDDVDENEIVIGTNENGQGRDAHQ